MILMPSITKDYTTTSDLLSKMFNGEFEESYKSSGAKDHHEFYVYLALINQ